MKREIEADSEVEIEIEGCTNKKGFYHDIVGVVKLVSQDKITDANRESINIRK